MIENKDTMQDNTNNTLAEPKEDTEQTRQDVVVEVTGFSLFGATIGNK